MNEQIRKSVENVWRSHSGGLGDAIDETIAELENLLRLDEHHRHGHDPNELERALGPMAATNLDIGALSRVLEGGTRSRAMAPERLERVQKLIPALGEMKDALSSTPLESASHTLDADESEIRERAEKHLAQVAGVFRAVRVAQLEISAKYEPDTHEAAFATFGWRQLSPGELRLCPPFVVTARLDRDRGAQLRKIMSLLETGMPIKVIALRSSLRAVFAAAADTNLPSAATIETLPLAMRGVYFVQTCAVTPNFQEELFKGLTAPRPCVISVLCPRGDEDQAAFQSRAERAVRARAFPLCVYDPERADRFVQCFDLSSNPSPAALWINETFSDLDPEGEAIEIEERFTFAHFAASDAEFAADVSDLPAIDDHLVSMVDYLGFTRRQRMGKRPFVSLANDDGPLVRKVVSPEIALQCSERLHLWQTLQEIAGIDNPYVSSASASLHKELGAEKEAQLESLRQEMETKASHREQAAVASAVRKLIVDLTGIDPPQQ